MGLGLRKTPPQKRFWTPHLRYVSPPPLSWRLCVISLKRKRHRPDQPQFLRPPKVVLESTLCSTFPPPPPQIHVIRFAPPLSHCPIQGRDCNFQSRIRSFQARVKFACEKPEEFRKHSGVQRLTRSSLKGVLNRALFAYNNGCFASSFLPLGIGFLYKPQQKNKIYPSKVPLRNPI